MPDDSEPLHVWCLYRGCQYRPDLPRVLMGLCPDHASFDIDLGDRGVYRLAHAEGSAVLGTFDVTSVLGGPTWQIRWSPAQRAFFPVRPGQDRAMTGTLYDLAFRLGHLIDFAGRESPYGDRG